MGKQSSRIYFQGKDHKDIWFQGNYHNAMYVGSQLVWKKIIDKYCVMRGYIYNLLNGKKINKQNNFYVDKSTPILSIGHCYIGENRKEYIAITKDLLNWKTIKEIDIGTKNYHVSASEEGFFIYVVNDGIYYLKIIKGLKYSIEKIRGTISGSYVAHNLYGISSYFYYITKQFSGGEITYMLHRVYSNGETTSGTLGGYFANQYASGSTYSNMAVVNEIIFIVADSRATSATNKGTRVLKIADMDLESIYTELFIGESNDYFDDYGDINVIYDGYQVAYLATNRGGNNYEKGYSYKYKFAKMRYYLINPIGVLQLIKENTNKENLVIPIKNYWKMELVISFMENGEEGENQEYTDCKELVFGVSERTEGKGVPSTSLIINNEARNQQCIVARRSGTNEIIYINNLFFDESEENYAIMYETESEV